MNDRWEGSRSPRNGQFQKGHSGNPNGRPRKPVAVPEVRRSAFDIVLEKRVTITEGGRERELSVEEALQMRTYKNALDGNRAAQREVLKWIEKRNKAMGHVEQRMTPHAEIRMREESQGTPTNQCVFSASPVLLKSKGDMTPMPYSSNPGQCRPHLAGGAVAKHSPRRT